MTHASPNDRRKEPVPVGRFLWERLMMVSDLPQEDRFKLLALGMYMDGETGDNARPGAANLALLGHHEETWKQLLRRTVAAGWLILRERGGSRKGPNGTRIKKASRYAASVPADVYDRRREILGAPPFKAASTKEARESYEGSASRGRTLPSKTDRPTNEASNASFKTSGPVDNSSGGVYEGSPNGLPATSTKEAPGSTKEASGVYEGSADDLRRKSLGTSPSISPPSHIPTSKIRSDLIDEDARTQVQDQRGGRWLIENWPGVTEPIAAHVVQAVRAEALYYGSKIASLVPYLREMHKRGDLSAYVDAAFNHFDALEAAAEPEAEPERTPLTAVPGGASSSGDPTATQPSMLLHAIDGDQADEPEQPLYDQNTGEDHRAARPLLDELKRKWSGS